jgi:hypothetical protein
MAQATPRARSARATSVPASGLSAHTSRRSSGASLTPLASSAQQTLLMSKAKPAAGHGKSKRSNRLS